MTSGDVLEKATACGITACEVTAREITVYGAFRDTACEITAFGVTAFASEGTAIEDTQDGRYIGLVNIASNECGIAQDVQRTSVMPSRG